ncbi:serine/threonine-protein kinase, partial [Actinomyces slackii]
MTQNPDVRSSGLTMLSGLRAGTHLGGYRLLRRLGAGGMGVVWEVVDGGGKHVAMKILHPQIAADPTARRRLDREASVLARVRDTRVARILDIETGDDEESGAGVTFVITELVDGPTLQHEVDHEGVYDLGTDARDLADLAHGLVTALRAVHDAGVIHRDLKPSNVMLGAQGPVLIDFGIAQVADDVRLTQTGQVTGTPGFIPPEMLDGGEPTPDVDWYACAGVLLFTVTGQAPFGSGAWQVVFRRVYAGTPELGSLPEECPALARAFTAALAPDAKDRISPDELVAVLDEIAEGGTGQEALDKVLGPEEELDEGSAGYGIVSGSDQASSASSPVSTAAASYGYVAGSGRPAASAPQPQTPPPSIPPRISPVASSGPP